MLEVLPIRSFDELKAFYFENNLDLKDGSGCVVARASGEILGYCAYTLEPKKVIITAINPAEDLPLADGLLRSALHIADFNGISDAFYDNETLEVLFNKLNFIKNIDDKSLRIEKLKQSCCSCEN